MSDFAHVTDGLVRRVLLREVGGDAIADAITITENAWQHDATNEEVPFDVLDARDDALGEALFYWNDEGDEHRTVEALRTFWSV